MGRKTTKGMWSKLWEEITCSWAFWISLSLYVSVALMSLELHVA
jgi:hypothetical protein